MKVSLIIPTYNGASKVLNILKALEKQTFRNFEVIVVIDGSSDNTKETLENFKTGLDLKIFYRQNGGRAVARNTGAREAKGDLLIFFDDDMRPMPDCVEQHVTHHQKYINSICVGSAMDDRNFVKTDFHAFRIYINNTWSKNLPVYPIPMNSHNLLLAAANCSINKMSFLQLGGFDERLTDAEDFELGTRAHEKGFSIYYNSQARAFHDDPVTCRSYIRRQREYTKAHIKLHKIRPEIVGNYSNASIYKPSPLKKVVFCLFANKFFVHTIDHFNFYRFVMPQKVRYKLYDLVVWGMAKVFPDRQL
ncbi:glycosyltransferase family 2 protein [Rhodocytophaga aerolata]|uniref:Glycosyltransferase family 2 protein n=1 Tax=Rhodocytophaga aerolata TaxID=455078 RepID=A0ABT8RA31_9BACT|nr:glycosyltransferase family 2 protein [Rhodocytophaga aerolata]MDO1448849.1 glycosyltransferase family 2 protein [Rhodocytophaga aerolata]